jgi:hypothetical protein
LIGYSHPNPPIRVICLQTPMLVWLDTKLFTKLQTPVSACHKSGSLFQ